MTLPRHVKIVEVSPRDGLQNEAQSVPAEVKIEFINRLSATGLQAIEATSFVSPKKIPQLADAHQVFTAIHKQPGIAYPVLVPNLQGFHQASQAGVREIAVFTAVSDSFTQKNINCSIAESLQRIQEIIAVATAENIKIRAYISCVLGCPYEGEMSAEKVAGLAKKLWDLGCHEISLGDTIGVGTPGKTVRLIDTVIGAGIPLENIAVHFHDTYGQALANIYAALEKGVHIIDSSAAGLGGCPYAAGASGNVATEDVLYLLQGLGIHTGVDLEKIIAAGTFITDYLKRPNRSKVAAAYRNKQP